MRPGGPFSQDYRSPILITPTMTRGAVGPRTRSGGVGTSWAFLERSRTFLQRLFTQNAASCTKSNLAIRARSCLVLVCRLDCQVVVELTDAHGTSAAVDRCNSATSNGGEVRAVSAEPRTQAPRWPPITVRSTALIGNPSYSRWFPPPRRDAIPSCRKTMQPSRFEAPRI